MKYANIINKKIPAVVLGTWSWGSGFIGAKMIFGNSVHEKNMKIVYQKAIESGLIAFDTAPVYGMGAAETTLGNLKEEKDNLWLSTKFMPFWLQPKSTMARSLEGSLERLKVDQVDIFWVHVPRNVQKWTTQLIPLLKANKVRYVGVSNHNLQEIIQAKKILEKAGLQLAAVQNHFSLLYQSCIHNGILSWCKKNNIAFFSYMVLEQGALTSRYNKDNPFPKHTRRSRAFPPEMLEKIEPLICIMKNLANKYGVDVAEIAIAYALNKQTIAIIGATKTHHIESIKRAMSIDLLSEEMSLLESSAKMTNVKVKGFWERRM